MSTGHRRRLQLRHDRRLSPADRGKYRPMPAGRGPRPAPGNHGGGRGRGTAEAQSRRFDQRRTEPLGPGRGGPHLQRGGHRHASRRDRQRARLLQGSARHPLRPAGRAGRGIKGAAGATRLDGPGRRDDPPVHVDGHGQGQLGHAHPHALRRIHCGGHCRGQAPEPPVAGLSGSVRTDQAACATHHPHHRFIRSCQGAGELDSCRAG